MRIPAQEARRVTRHIVTLSLLLPFSIPVHDAQAGLLTDTALFAYCKATDGDWGGCNCAVEAINESFDADFILIIEARLSGENTRSQVRALGFMREMKMGAQMYRFVGTAGYRCNGVKLFILKVSESLS